MLENDYAIFQKLTKNSSIFTNLNISTSQILSENSIEKLNSMFQLFSGISSNYSSLSLPVIFGKSLCGPDFSFSLESFGYSFNIGNTEPPIDNPYNTSNSTNSTTPAFNMTTMSPTTARPMTTRKPEKDPFNQGKNSPMSCVLELLLTQ